MFKQLSVCWWHISNITRIFIIFIFQLRNKIFGKMPLNKEHKPRICGMSGKIILMKLFDWALSMIFKKKSSSSLLITIFIFWIVNWLYRSHPTPHKYCRQGVSSQPHLQETGFTSLLLSRAAASEEPLIHQGSEKLLLTESVVWSAQC